MPGPPTERANQQRPDHAAVVQELLQRAVSPGEPLLELLDPRTDRGLDLAARLLEPQP